MSVQSQKYIQYYVFYWHVPHYFVKTLTWLALCGNHFGHLELESQVIAIELTVIGYWTVVLGKKC